MKYEEAKTLTAKEFKRLSGVYPETFNKMVEIVQNYQKTKKVSRRPSKLSIENQILMALKYFREYRTYFHIGKTWEVYESTTFRIIQKIENILIKSRVLKLPGKKKLIDTER
ncbi:MAG: transposase family protein [Pleurocapsa sp. MO_226.B13]|nr:transposase family protein [Pleurocapsa sp. MO_226.B13]